MNRRRFSILVGGNPFFLVAREEMINGIAINKEEKKEKHERVGKTDRKTDSKRALVWSYNSLYLRD